MAVGANRRLPLFLITLRRDRTVHLYSRTNSWSSWTILGALVCVCIFVACFASESEQQPGQSDDNAKCYVCHSGLKTEDITTSHVEMGITCDECHGTSTEHMHDEMLMTEPDLLYGRAEVQKMCSDPSCHKPGEGRLVYSRQDHKDLQKVEEFFEKWKGRNRPNGRVVSAESVCTDCHGTHNLNKDVEDTSDEQPVAIFNGKDLSGWKTSGKASWIVKSGRIIAKQSSDGEAGILWTQSKYADYELALTFRADWPIHAGIHVHGDGSNLGPRVEICDDAKTGACTGSVLWPGKGLVLLNLDDELIDKEYWNTISIKAEGRRVNVWLNGEEIGAVRTAGPDEGKVGFHIGGDPSNKTAELTIREVIIKRLNSEK